MTDRSDESGRDELAELRAMGRRLGAEPLSWEAPPAGLWERIAEAAGVPAGDEAIGEADGGSTQLTGSEPAGATVHPFDRPAAASGGRPSGRDGRTRRGAGRWIGLLAAAAAAVVAVAAVGALTRWGGSDSETLMAAGELERLGETGSGRAELVERDGQMRIRLETSDVEASGAEFLEVWVIDPEVSRLISLGPLRSDGLYDLPAGLDPEAFPIVDVSVEPMDGDPTHSGNSVLRGQLTF